MRQNKKLVITSRKQVSPFSNFTLALVFINYICKISISNSCVIEDVRPLGCCVLSTDKERDTAVSDELNSFIFGV